MRPPKDKQVPTARAYDPLARLAWRHADIMRRLQPNEIPALGPLHQVLAVQPHLHWSTTNILSLIPLYQQAEGKLESVGELVRLKDTAEKGDGASVVVLESALEERDDDGREAPTADACS